MRTQPLDATQLIEQYREASQRAVTAQDEFSREKWRAIATRLYKRWQEYSGDDDLHDVAFGRR